jgi:transcriptional regulator with PAS, ATPase and Fis domain
VAPTEEKIAIQCILRKENFDGFSQVIAKIEHGLKEDIELLHIPEAPGPDFVKNDGIYVVDRAEIIPEYHFYYYKKCRLYYYTSEMADTEEWVKNVLLDGIVLESSDTSIKTFLEDTINHEYLRGEDRYIKNIEEWLSLSGVPGGNQMLTVSFGKMRVIYNELKKFVMYEQLRDKYDQPESRVAYHRFIDTLYRADAVTETREKQKILQTALGNISEHEERLHAEGVHTVSILLTGETGVGKTLLSEYFQQYLLKGGGRLGADSVSSVSPIAGKYARPDKLNCSQLGKEQIRTELFGAIKGTYTDQAQTIPGRILENALSIFVLDEIADMDLALQPQLLSYLDDSRIHLQNLAQSVYAPLIFIATTNRNIPELISRGDFRNDLYERFDLHLHIPPIRERRDEIKPFIKMMLGQERNRRPRIFKELHVSKAFIEHMKAYDYSDGNFRELQRIVRGAVRNCISQGRRIIKIEHLGD